MADVLRHPRDSRSRPYIQIRLYGQIALDVDTRADAEGKSRSTLVHELISAGWNVPMSPPTPIEPSHAFVRQPTRTSHDDNATTHEAPAHEGTRRTARVFAPRGRR